MEQVKLDNINLADIDEGDRARVKYENIDELIDSIKENGLITPVALLDKSKVENWAEIGQKIVDDKRPYLLLAGGRRVSAYKEGKLNDLIPARIYNRPLTYDEIKQIELVENVQRANLTWHERLDLEEEINSLQIKIKGKRLPGQNKSSGHTIEDTGKLLGKSKSSVSKDLKLAKILKSIPELKKAKSKHDAEKMIKSLGKYHETEQRAKEIKERLSSSSNGAYKKKLVKSFIVGDAREKMKSLPDEAFNLIEIDPPYAIDLHGNKRTGKENMMTYDEVPPEDFPELMQNIFKEAYRAAKNDSWIICWFGPDPWFAPLLDWMRMAGWKVRGIPGIWVKKSGQTNRPDRYLANSYEMFFYGSKGNPTLYKQGRLNTLPFPQITSHLKTHTTEKPIELLEHIIETFTGGRGRVLVPFLGSGITLLAASNFGMEGIGFDLSQQHHDNFVLKVDKGKPGEYKSYAP